MSDRITHPTHGTLFSETKAPGRPEVYRVWDYGKVPIVGRRFTLTDPAGVVVRKFGYAIDAERHAAFLLDQGGAKLATYGDEVERMHREPQSEPERLAATRLTPFDKDA